MRPCLVKQNPAPSRGEAQPAALCSLYSFFVCLSAYCLLSSSQFCPLLLTPNDIVSRLGFWVFFVPF